MSFRTELTATIYPDPRSPTCGDDVALKEALVLHEFQAEVHDGTDVTRTDAASWFGHGRSVFYTDWRTSEVSDVVALTIVTSLHAALEEHDKSIGPCDRLAGPTDYIGPMFEAQWDDAYWVGARWLDPFVARFLVHDEAGIVIPLDEHLAEPHRQYFEAHRSAIDQARARAAAAAPDGVGDAPEFPLLKQVLEAIVGADDGSGSNELRDEVLAFIGRDDTFKIHLTDMTEER